VSTLETQTIVTRGRGAAPRPVSRHRVARRARGVLRGLAIGVVLVVLGAPIAWMAYASVKTSREIIDPDAFWSATAGLDNYASVLLEHNFGEYTLNSLIIAVCATVLAIVVGVPAAYAVSRFKVQSVAAFVLLARVIPAVCLLVPWYYIFAQIGLVGTYQALILAHVFVTLPLVVAIMSGFFDGMPMELEEAGLIDGLSRIGAFLRITVRLAVPGIATSAILAFIFSWNNFIFALVLSGSDTVTLPAAIFRFISYLGVDWGGLMAASMVITFPIVLIALFAQRYIVSGLSAGATKG
jgi:multiple sugar transport system permease protein